MFEKNCMFTFRHKLHQRHLNMNGKEAVVIFFPVYVIGRGYNPYSSKDVMDDINMHKI